MEKRNIDSALELINKTVTENYSIKVNVPSVTTSPISLKPLNIFQQKKLISLTVEQDIYNSKFNEILYDIIKENYLSADLLPVSALTIFDKAFIALALRASINNNITSQDNTPINIESLITNLYAAYTNNSNLTEDITFNYNNITITCNLPTIELEVMCDLAKMQIKSTDIADQIQNIIAETVTNEIVKFIKIINIDTEVISLSDFSFAERKRAIEQLPAIILEKVLNYILEYKQCVEKILTYKTAENTDIIIQINSTFFATA